MKDHSKIKDDRNTFMSPNVADLHRPFNNRNRFDRQVTGSIELAYMRGEHAGYLKGYRDAKAGRKKQVGSHIKKRPRRKPGPGGSLRKREGRAIKQ